jgi:hypothetical protein
MTPDEALESRANQDVLDPTHPCHNCGHDALAHMEESIQGGVFCIAAQYGSDNFCGCQHFVPIELAELREEEEL